MNMDLLHSALALLSGGAVGFTLGLVGGGGSILAVPLMLYVVGVHDPHIAIGTSALAVAANAATGLFHHARAGNVRWKCGGVFAAAGILGAALGSSAGKAFNGQHLLFLFALLMLLVAALMLRHRHAPETLGADCDRERAPRVAAFGFGTGAFSGFFGIGGGFLIVPGLIGSTGMPILNAVATSLVAVTAFGLTTAANYALSGLVDWLLAALFIAGGIFGGVAGSMAARGLAAQRGRLTTVFAELICVVAVYMLARSF
ncbi:sulfite exporter TauE/SafE family protein [Acidocella sp. KAb 2-4]|uniref:sulfite exporter TauE/SafE family protein n=1 Tax=Acidocella sp. KAb 2-4 TaxID=2885158 RepID=UPI001D05CD84|nr:sulfite exporter TauE/SafE family protein [Acidocella sp. KAb 2-4]MCB5944028.1 sulfite exporter TauE/SafE family protein [Acidocella sp. KAb 2-4]